MLISRFLERHLGCLAALAHWSGSSCILISSCALTAESPPALAPNLDAGPVNQLVIAGNACGPAALLASLQSGDPRWSDLAHQLPGKSDRGKLNYLIRAHGLVPSGSLKNQHRWTREGINAPDLTDLAGEVASLASLPTPKYDLLFAHEHESSKKLTKRLHKRLKKSLAHGFPPIVSLRRYVEQNGDWQAVQSHFITIVRIPGHLDRNDSAFTFTYFDPWGGKTSTADMRMPANSILGQPQDTSPSTLEAVMPDAHIGKDQIPKNARSIIVPTVVIGIW